MDDYISREKVLQNQYLSDMFDRYALEYIPVINARVVETIPAADVRPVMRGEWLKSEWGYPDRTLTCNVCGFEYDSTDYNHPKFQQKLLHYCPNCGATMMGGNNDDA